MKSKLAQIIFSTRLMAVLFLVFAAAMITGTFLDMGADTSPTPYSNLLVYHTWWFEAIMGFFIVNFCGNIFRYRLLRKEKLSVLILHLAFILVLLGAFVTRYVGFEGMMPIREGNTSSSFLSREVYLQTFIDGDYEVDGVLQRRVLEEPMLMSERLDNDFTINTDYNGAPISISYVKFVENVEKKLVPSDTGKNYLKLVEAGGGERHDHMLEEGTVSNIHNILFAFNKPTKGAINITFKEGEYPTIEAPFDGDVMRMADQQKTAVVKDSIHELKLRSLYNLADTQFVFPEGLMKGEYGIAKVEDKKKGQQDALTLKIAANNESKEVTLMGGVGMINEMTTVKVGGYEFHLRYGSKQRQLPFAIKLNDFIAEKYPGNEKAYKSFMSKVTVQDEGNISFDYDIFMNNILDHKGYRFFQASFDPDEKGTILSVNHDFYGTWITYIGYILLFIAMIAILVDKNGRFIYLKNQLKKIRTKKEALVIAFVMFSVFGWSQEQHEHHKKPIEEVSKILKERAFPKEEAAKFGELIIQDYGGRMKPANTYACELLRKLSGGEKYEDTENGVSLDANQVLLSMMQNNRLWFDVPIIMLKRGNDSIRRVLQVPLKTKYVALADFYSPTGEPKISDKKLKEATSAFNPNKFQQDIKKAFEQQQFLNQVLSGGILKIFPIPNDPGNKWVSYPELGQVDYGSDEANKNTRLLLYAYFQEMVNAKQTGDYSRPTAMLDGIKNLQKKYSASILPSEGKVKAEIAYNKYNIFKRLMRYNMMFAVLLLVILVFQIFNDNKGIRIAVGTFKGLIILCFVLHTAGLIARWYISGHAPWSDAYESIIYVAWATGLFGLILGRKSNITIAATAFVVGMLLWVADMNFIDPAIGNLEPVLDSYWLLIHVAIIVGSYGPFALAAMLGVLALLLMILTNKNNKKKLDLQIKELTAINEMALTVGVVMLTIGTFLGGMWANESWGRYWGWDPKETWALISVMIYAFIIHMRLVPGLRDRWTFNWLSIVGFGAVLFTYFGVNFYLVGLHSYASGDKTVSTKNIIISAVLWVILGIFSYIKFKAHYKKQPAKSEK